MAARGIQDGKTYDSGKLGKSFNRRFLQQIAYNHRSYCLSRSSTKPSLRKAVIIKRLSGIANGQELPKSARLAAC